MLSCSGIEPMLKKRRNACTSFSTQFLSMTWNSWRTLSQDGHSALIPTIHWFKRGFNGKLCQIRTVTVHCRLEIILHRPFVCHHSWQSDQRWGGARYSNKRRTLDGCDLRLYSSSWIDLIKYVESITPGNCFIIWIWTRIYRSAPHDNSVSAATYRGSLNDVSVPLKFHHGAVLTLRESLDLPNGTRFSICDYTFWGWICFLRPDMYYFSVVSKCWTIGENTDKPYTDWNFSSSVLWEIWSCALDSSTEVGPKFFHEKNNRRSISRPNRSEIPNRVRNMADKPS